MSIKVKNNKIDAYGPSNENNTLATFLSHWTGKISIHYEAEIQEIFDGEAYWSQTGPITYRRK